MGAWRSFRGQLALSGVAGIALLALTAILVRDVIVGAEERIVAAAEQQCALAAAELAQQYRERLAFRADDSLETLPLEAQDLSLRALSATVLRAYEGVRGGFLVDGRLLGSAGAGAVELGEEERSFLVSLEAGSAREEVGADFLVGATAPLDDGGAAWAMKRLPNAADSVPSQRRWLLGALALSALMGFGALISVSLQLRRGVENLREGLRRLESDLSYRLPEVAGDLGGVAESINRMAEARDSLEQHVRQQERLAALGRVVGGVAHEIRNPLNSMRLTLELLARRIRKQRADAGQIDEAIAEVDRLDEILTKLLAFGRPGTEVRTRQAVAPLIERAAGMAEERATRRNIRIDVDLNEAREAEATADGAQVEQVLLNLLLNAVEASPDGSRVEVSLRNGGGAVTVEVTDHGEGVAEEVRGKIFDPYFTTKDTGSGLGLAVSREIVRRHGGELGFRSRPGETVFSLSLPAPDEGAK